MAGVVLVSTLGADSMTRPADLGRLQPMRMVYVALPGPGGGGGGGGMRQMTPPPKAKRQGTAKVSSPVPVRKAPPVEPPAKPPEPPPAAPPVVQPPVAAPVAEVPGDDQNRAGLPAETPAVEESRGTGTGGGTGSGSGTGIGEGDGPGLGPGSGGGTGGGPYRPGSGVEPPVVLREVRPTYTETARQRGISGEVVLEIVVLRDGTVGRVRVLNGLGGGLDEKAIEAVRQWKFDPARLRGTPVDVMVEVAVEFKLR
jgi:TonB family protein